MSCFKALLLASGAALAVASVRTPAAQAASAASEGSPGAAGGSESIVVVGRLDDARSQLQPGLGATRYEFTRKRIQALPQGDNAPLNQLLLQVPGVAQDSFGQIHVRGDHNEVQFRLDGVQLPEGLSVFGQALETRFAHSLSLVTGALPAQYGFLQAAVIDITSKSGTTDPGGEISIYGGARDFMQPSFTYGGASGPVDYFVTGDFLHTRVGIENPTASFNPVHDLSNQYHGLAHVSGLIDADTRISLTTGISNDVFQIPNNPNQTPGLGLSVDGTDSVNSADLTEHQREITDFAILSLQKHFDSIDLQSSVFTRYSSLYFSPDPIGDLLYTGIAQRAARSVVSSGMQTDASWRVSTHHTVRAGFQVQGEQLSSSTTSSVLPTDDAGVATSSQPISLHDGSGKTGGLYGLYLQDEWRILPRVTVNLGARFDVVDEYVHANQISPRANIVYRATDTTTLHVGYSRYFTPPPFELVSANSVALFNNTTASSEVRQSAVVKAERDNYYDAGIEQILLPGLRVGVDGYYKSATNLIDEGQFGAPIILSAFNYLHGQVSGLEFSSSYDHGPWSLYGNLAYSRAIGKTIDSAQFNFSAADLAYISQRWIHLDHDQRWSSSAGAAYTAFRKSGSPLQMSADLIIGSGLRRGSDIPNGAALPGYYTVNISASQTLHLAGLRGTQLRFDITNLLDRRYEIRDGTGVGVGAPQFGLRRTILAGMTQRF